MNNNATAALDDSALIHITGLYKCGTSWLSHILAAHSAVIAWREFDIVRATHSEQLQPTGRRIATKLSHWLKLPPPNRLNTEFALKCRSDMVRDIFVGRGWIPLMGDAARAHADQLPRCASDPFIDQLMALREQTLRADHSASLQAQQCAQTLGVSNTRRQDLFEFYDAVQHIESIADVPRFFFSYLQKQCEPGTRMVLKAADQVMALRQLQHYSPHSQKLAIIRDGRDAAISASHYRQLMGERQAPWALKPRTYFEQLADWAIRARELANWADKNAITIVRYEDLKRSFLPVSAALFTNLGLPYSDQSLARIQRATDFSAASGGRSPGQAAQHVVRKGSIGEWATTLDKKAAKRAWRIAGTELSRFGYTQNNRYEEGIAGLLSPI